MEDKKRMGENMPRILFAAPKSGSGKTMITLRKSGHLFYRPGTHQIPAVGTGKKSGCDGIGGSDGLL